MSYETAESAEQAFYRAFGKRETDAMMALWKPVGDVLCIHPMGPVLSDLDTIRESWTEIFAAPIERKITTTLLAETRTSQCVVRAVIEHFSIPGRPETFAPVFATNTFWRGDGGWYIAAHHASPGQFEEPAATQDGGQTRH